MRVKHLYLVNGFAWVIRLIQKTLGIVVDGRVLGKIKCVYVEQELVVGKYNGGLY